MYGKVAGSTATALTKVYHTCCTLAVQLLFDSTHSCLAVLPQLLISITIVQPLLVLVCHLSNGLKVSTLIFWRLWACCAVQTGQSSFFYRYRWRDFHHYTLNLPEDGRMLFLEVRSDHARVK